MRIEQQLRLALLVATPVFAFLVSACGGEAKQVQAKAPARPAVARAVTAGPQTASGRSSPPTATNVSISEEVLRDCNIPDADAYFAFDSSHLQSFDRKPLDEVARCFTHGPLAGRKLHLVGHADPRGTPDYNMALGQSRADAVAAFLVTDGVRHANAQSTSRGSMDAIGRDETGWAHDRRVDVLLAN